ncbi:helix-turn-helix domain-containing protein [Nocardia aurantia]|uniref:Putative HTH-type transcriptional regulator n=1 Tax=Nocardia aurantia TaxID=2585199 RepID=A0A7K0E1X2_9NOCA|nr:AraC family transcriptional regulator [Nocardia aurantia]MQY32015.1 putative HTH-type transcriptional regulator [Nocardia aurantia]
MTRGTGQVNRQIRICSASNRNRLHTLGDGPGVGTEVAMRFSLTNFRLLGFAMLSSPIAGEALRVALNTLQIGNRFIDTAVTFGRTTGRIEFRTDTLPGDVRAFLLERDTVLICGVLVLRCLGPSLRDRLGETRLELALPHRSVAAVTDGMTRLLSDISPNPVRQLPIVADRPVSNLTFPLDLLTEPMSMPDPATAALCERHCLELLQQRRERGKFATGIRSAMLTRIDATANDVAATLNLDVRTLRRRLADEGTTFGALRDEVRCTLALDMLGPLGLTVRETASRLGYSSPAAFSRVFTCWTGEPPSTHRRT